jgi:hypothetical protein
MPHADPEQRRECTRKASRAYYEKNKEAVKARTKATKEANKVKWASYKSTLSCVYCGYNEHPSALDFHHVVRGPGNAKVYKLAADNSWARLWEEIKKCIVLCAVCHRHLHNSVEFENKVLDKVAHQFKAVKRVHK